VSVLSPTDERVVGRFVARARDIFGERLVRALLFGSKARGDDEESSDIDVLLVVEGLRSEDQRMASLAAWRAGIRDNAVICATCYSAEEFEEQRRLPFLATALKEGIHL